MIAALVVRVRCPRCRRWVRFVGGTLETHEAAPAVACAPRARRAAHV